MGNLIGEPFEGYVANQINVRQKIHGSGTGETSRTSKQLSYLNSKTAWVKLASGVYVSEDRIRKLGFNDHFKGKELAKNFVLQGGVTRIDKDGEPNFRGINPDGEDRNGIFDHYTGPYNVNAAGQNSGLEFGLVPMPGIETVEVKFMNRGSIKRATVKLKAYNKAQFDIIDALYLRLGYTVLMEWGNSMFVKDADTGDLINTSSTLINNNKGWFSNEFSKLPTKVILSNIRALRSGHAGNYDGMYGKVTNFTWSFNDDGSYDIELKLISHGDIIESLKLNTVPNPELSRKLNVILEKFKSDLGDLDQKTLSDAPNPTDNIISAYLFLQKSYLYENYSQGNKDYFKVKDILYKDVDGGENGKKGVGIFVLPPEDGKIDIDIEESWFWESEYINRREEIKKKYKEAFAKGEVYWGAFDSGDPTTGIAVASLAAAGSVLGPVGTAVGAAAGAAWDYLVPFLLSVEGTLIIKPTTVGKVGKKDIIYMNYIEEDDRSIHGKGFYMRFGHLLQFIQTNCIPKVQPKGSDKKNAYSILKIMTETWSSKMLYYPHQTSLDPRVCVVNSDVGISANSDKSRYQIFKQLMSWKNPDKGYAWTMNIYVNHDVIQNALTNNLDEQGNVAFFPMISEICSALNKALGGINNLEPVIDEAEGTLKIIDGSYSADKQYKPPTPEYQIEAFGYNNTNNTSNFLRNIDLKTEITKEYADMITIGATANGYVKGTEATAFSKWSEGYTDRFKQKVIPATNGKDPDSNEFEPATNYFKNYYNTGIDLMLGYKYIDVDNDVTSNDAPQLQDDIIDNNIAVVTEYYRYINEKARTASGGQFASKTNGFIPFNLGLTLDGISGIKIYNKINVDTRFLPQNYPDALQFIVKGVNHKLSNNDWETQIETQAIPESLENKASYNLLSGIIQQDILAKGKKVEYKSIVDTRPKDQDGNTDYTPGGNPTYTPVQPYTPVKNAPEGWDGLSTLTSGFPMKKSQYRADNKQKTQIYIHYTAGHQKSNKGKSSAESLYDSNLSCHAIIDIDGHIERMVPDNYSAKCQGGGSPRKSNDIWPNQTGLSIEVQGLGYERGGGLNFNAYGKGQPLTGCVDWQGNPISEYRGHKRYQDYSDAQIGAIKTLCMDWLKNHNIPFVYNKQTYDDMFPPKNTNSRAVMKGKPGIWTHNSVTTGKSDIQPSLSIINMLKEISDEVNGPTKEELAAQAAALAKKHADYKKKIKNWADKLHYSMEGGNTYENIFNKVVAETTAEQRMDIAAYFDSFAELKRCVDKTNRKYYSNQFRLSRYKEDSFTELSPAGSILGRWGGAKGLNYTKEKGQAPLARINDNRYGGYTLAEWIIGDFSGAEEAKNLALFGIPKAYGGGNYDSSDRIYKPTKQ